MKLKRGTPHLHLGSRPESEGQDMGASVSLPGNCLRRLFAVLDIRLLAAASSRAHSPAAAVCCCLLILLRALHSGFAGPILPAVWSLPASGGL